MVLVNWSFLSLYFNVDILEKCIEKKNKNGSCYLDLY